METLEREINLSQVQSDFHYSPALYRAFCGGVGSGKTWVGAFDLLARSLPDHTYMAGSPTSVMMRDNTFPTFEKIARSLNLWGSVRMTPYPTVTTSEGATIRFRTADNPETMRGPNLSGIWLDEASLMPQLVYDISIARLREGGGSSDWLSATFTPKGPNHWTHEVFATNKADTAIFRAHTSANPFLSTDYESRLAAQYGDTNWARQELGGEFVQLEGAEFPAEWLTGEDLWFDEWPSDLFLKVIALDPSKGSDGGGKDFQAHVLIGLRAIGEPGTQRRKVLIYVDAIVLREGVTQMCDRTVSICRAFSQTAPIVASVIVEENGTMGFLPPAMNAAAAEAKYLMPWMCRTNTERKESRIRQQVAPPLSHRQIRFRRSPGGRKLVGQLQSFPFDEHDDAIDALSTGLKRVAELLTPTR